VVTYHSDIIRQAALVPFIEPILWPFLRKAASVIATSPVYVESSRFLRNLGNVEIVPLGVDTTRFRPGSAAGAGEYFLFVGRFRRYKGIPVLLEAWRSLPGVRLVMVGQGPLQDSVRHASELPGSSIEMRGEVGDDELLELYRGARALILPSTERSEAFGLVQLEAMACATPVISTNLRTGVPWVNLDGSSGIVVEPGDAPALAGAVRRMLDDGVRQSLSEGALCRVREKFRLDTMLESIERIYADAIRRGG
jgi:rhamnosyl/mannosyltransferase